MKFDAFIGGSYQAAAFSADQEHTINWYPEVVSQRGATSQMILLPSPGVEPVSIVYDGVGRGHLSMGGREWGVFGDKLYEISEEGSKTALGSPGTDDKATSPVTIDSNGDLGDQLLIVSDERAGYVDTSTLYSPFQTIAALTGKSTMGGYLDGYGLCLDARESILYISNLGDFSTWTTGTDFTQRSLAADPWESMKVVGRYIWMFGQFTTEIWHDVGANFPFAPLVNNVIQWGVRAQYSPANVDGNVCWLAQNASGRVCVMRAGGVNPEIISTPALEAELSTYTDLGGAVGDAYSWNGHTFYILNFDNDDISWCWDATTNQWHQRGTWDNELGKFRSWSPRWFQQAFGEVRALDRMILTDPSLVDSATTSSFVYKLSETFPVDVNGKAIRRVRRAPALVNENKRVQFSEFEIHMDTGFQEREENYGTASATAQTASIASTALFTAGVLGDDLKSYIISLGVDITTTTTDYSLYGQVSFYIDGTLVTHAFPGVFEGQDRQEASISIRPDPGTVVSYSTSYASGVGTMAYSVAFSADTPGAEDPQAMLRWSDDGGKTWSSEHWKHTGKVGEYGTRVDWHRLGTARRRVFELAVSDAIPWRLTAAYMDVKPGKY